MTDLAGYSLIGVFAHPDDESLTCGGLLAWSASRGARVSLWCASGGEHGAGAGLDSPYTPGDLRRARVEELRKASAVLGVSDVTVLDFEDGMLPWVASAPLEAAIRDAIVQAGADVVITFADDGLYGHPDHVAIHERTTAAVRAMGTAAPVLYYVTMPRDSMTAVVRHVAVDGAPVPLRILGIADPDAFGCLAPPPTLVVDVGGFAEAKLAAIKCHRTQLEHDALDRLTPADALRLLRIEHFHRAGAGDLSRAFIERLAASAS